MLTRLGRARLSAPAATSSRIKLPILSLVGELATYLSDETWVGSSIILQNVAYCSLSMGKLDV